MKEPNIRKRKDDWIALIQTGSLKSGTNYLLIPKDNPRLCIPTNSLALFRKALSFHRPARITARLAITVCKQLSWIGFRILPHSERVKTVSFSEKRYGKSPVIYLGTECKDRKITVANFETNVVFKSGRSEVAKKSLSNEAVILQYLQSTKLASNTPKAISLTKGSSIDELCQSLGSRAGASKARLQNAIDSFITEMSRLSIGSELFELNDRTIRLRTSFGHGDFAPWNLFYTKAGLFVFDWEDGSMVQPLGFDAFYFETANAIHAQDKRSVAQLTRAAKSRALRTVWKNQENRRELNDHWRLWTIHNKIKHPSPMSTELANFAMSDSQL